MIPNVTWRPLRVDDAARCAELWNACFEVDGGYRMVEQEWVQELEDPDDNPAEDGMIAVDPDGRAIAVAFVQIPPAATVWRAAGWGAVRPAYRGKGIGGAVLRWREQRIAQRLALVDDRLPRFYWENLYESQSSPIQLLVDNGYRPVRHWFEMIRDVGNTIDLVPLEAGLRLVPYEERLAEPVRAANNDAFRDHWNSQPIPQPRWERHYVGGEFFRKDLSAVVLKDEQVVGFLLAACYPHDFGDRGRTEVWAETIGTRREFRSRGIASALISNWMRSVASAGYEFATLGVDASSKTSALGLYEKHGFRVDSTSTSYAKPLAGTEWASLDQD